MWLLRALHALGHGPMGRVRTYISNVITLPYTTYTVRAAPVEALFGIRKYTWAMARHRNIRKLDFEDGRFLLLTLD